MFTQKRATATEQRILNLLNSRGCELSMAKNQYEVYDLFGYDKNGDNSVFEVKERRSTFFNKSRGENTWYIDKAKIDKLLSLPVKAYVVVSVKGVDYVYNAKTISRAPVIIAYQNNTTAKGFAGQGVKVPKESYEWNLNEHICIL